MKGQRTWQSPLYIGTPLSILTVYSPIHLVSFFSDLDGQDCGACLIPLTSMLVTHGQEVATLIWVVRDTPAVREVSACA